MEYRNKENGIVIDVESKISGKNWEPFSGLNKKPVSQSAPTPIVKPEPEVDNLSGITKKEIMQELKAQGVKFDPANTKQVLYDLMMQKGN